MFEKEIKDAKKEIIESAKNIGFELGYCNWSFIIKADNFEEIKKSFCDTIIPNEKIEGIYTCAELEKIKNEIMNCK